MTYALQLVRTMEGHSSFVKSLAVSSDGRYLYSGSHDNSVKQWDTSNGAVRLCSCPLFTATACCAGATQMVRTMKGHSAPVSALAVSPDSRFLYSGSRDYSVRLWDASTGEVCAAEPVRADRLE